MLTNYKQSSCQTNKRSFPFQLIACNNVGMSVAGWSHAIFVSGARAVYCQLCWDPSRCLRAVSAGREAIQPQCLAGC